MKKLLLLYSSFFILSSAFSQGTWTQKANFPGAGRQLPTGIAIGNKGYVTCGNAGSIYYNDLWEYDPLTNAWTQMASLPGPGRYAAVGFTIGNKGYIGTGQNFTLGQAYNDLWEYDPATNSWAQKSNMGGIPRFAAAGFAIGTKGYIGCGSGAADFWEWDQPTDTWTQKMTLPINRQQAVGFSINTKGYISTGSYKNDLWEYDPVSDTWTQKANLPAATRVDAAAFVICNYAYLGTGGDGPLMNDFWKFDPAQNAWTQKANVPGLPRDDCPAFAIGNKGYIGLGDIGSYALDFYEYTPDTLACSNIPNTVFISSDTVFCNESGRCIDFTDHSTNNPTSWQWYFPGAVPDTSTLQNPTNICYSTPGTYAVKLVASNSNGSDSLTVSPMITFASGAAPPVLAFSGDTLFCSHESGYQWYFNGLPIPGATDSFYVVTGEGLYAVQITDANGCVRLSDGFPVSVKEHSALQGVKIYPNPAHDQFTVSGLQSAFGARLEMFNTLGECVYKSETINGQPQTVNASGFSKGIYVLKTTCKNEIAILKIVIE